MQSLLTESHPSSIVLLVVFVHLLLFSSGRLLHWFDDSISTKNNAPTTIRSMPRCVPNTMTTKQLLFILLSFFVMTVAGQDPTGQPTQQPTMLPSDQPSCQPSQQPSSNPTKPSGQPSQQPSIQPTDQPSQQPSSLPTKPSGQPSQQPSSQPSNQPSQQPSSEPTRPSGQPSQQPSVQPSNQPSQQPSSEPTRPSGQPSQQPSGLPSCQPSQQPSSQPTKPSGQPSQQPSGQPSFQPSQQPSSEPTRPSGQPSQQPSSQPSRQPTQQPTVQPSTPTGQPSQQPSIQPSSQPSQQPTMCPSNQPSSLPSNQPSGQPSFQPTSQPSREPSMQPTSIPTRRPTQQPTMQPTMQPSCEPTSHPSYVAASWGEILGEWGHKYHRSHSGVCDHGCSAHGYCLLNINCQCYTTLRGDPEWTGPDCSLRACPHDIAWVGHVVGANDLHPRMECSNKGLCDRKTGLCTCFPGYDGIACQRTSCPSNCYGRGVCLTESQLAKKAGRVYDQAWDATKALGCLCDAGYRGPSCEYAECPSGPDPLDGYGNESGRDCSGRGVCDYNIGMCDCFMGWFGDRCQHKVIMF